MDVASKVHIIIAFMLSSAIAYNKKRWSAYKSRLNLVVLNDVQQGLFHRASHVGCITADIEMRPLLQQLPHKLTTLSQPVLNVHLLGLQWHSRIPTM